MKLKHNYLTNLLIVTHSFFIYVGFLYPPPPLRILYTDATIEWKKKLCICVKISRAH